MTAIRYVFLLLIEDFLVIYAGLRKALV